MMGTKRRIKRRMPASVAMGKMLKKRPKNLRILPKRPMRFRLQRPSKNASSRAQMRFSFSRASLIRCSKKKKILKNMAEIRFQSTRILNFRATAIIILRKLMTIMLSVSSVPGFCLTLKWTNPLTCHASMRIATSLRAFRSPRMIWLGLIQNWPILSVHKAKSLFLGFRSMVSSPK